MSTELDAVALLGTEWKHSPSIHANTHDNSDLELMSSDDEDRMLLEEDPQEDKYILEALATLKLSNERRDSDFHERQGHGHERVGPSGYGNGSIPSNISFALSVTSSTIVASYSITTVWRCWGHSLPQGNSFSLSE
jgi:hypothetical protein